MSDRSETEPRVDDTQVIRVECYAGHRAESEPRRLFIGARAVAVTEVIDRWLDPQHRYFKLRGEDGGIYLIRHDTVNDHWDLTLFDSGRREETRLSCT